MTLDTYLILDYGIIESDGEDVRQLQKLSDAIIDLAAAALASQDPGAGVTAERLRAETKHLLQLIIALDEDDRLVTHSLYFSPEELLAGFLDRDYQEIRQTHGRETFWTKFRYRIRFRFLK